MLGLRKLGPSKPAAPTTSFYIFNEGLMRGKLIDTLRH